MYVPSFCSRCGESMPQTNAWPKTCIACGHIFYGNPVPVSVMIVIVEGRALLVERNIVPGRGKLACVSGFLDFRESPLEAAIRELEEETAHRRSDDKEILIPGLKLPPRAFNLFEVTSVPEQNLVLIFYLVHSSNEIREWWKMAQPHLERHRRSGPWNAEVTTIMLHDFHRLRQDEVAFDSHYKMLHRACEQYG